MDELTLKHFKELNCNSKNVYENRSLAKRGRENVRKKYGTKMKIYRCDMCNFYHLSSK